VGQKLAFVQKLGAGNWMCIGNGRNDRMMLEAAANRSFRFKYQL
jgi:hydroxymethylpyrimidine pyrophosphatase-like HAD family hydrolase